MADYFAKFRDLGMTWFKHLGELPASDADMVRAAADAGMEPVVRIYVPRRFPHPLDAAELSRAVAAYVRAGAHYFETGNEPNLDVEWESGQFAAYQNRHIATLVGLWLEDARIVRAAGGIPLVYAMSVGSSQPDGRLQHHWWADFLQELQRRNALDALDGAGFAIHAGALNHPLAYPLDARNVADHGITETDVSDAMLAHDDSTCYQSVRLIQRMLREHGLRDVPVLSTEGGAFPWDRSDPRYPELSPDGHRDVLLEIYRRFNPRHAEYWGDALFCQCSWLAIAGSNWWQDQWLDNRRYGGDLPIVPALRAEPRFERVLGGEMAEIPDVCKLLMPRADWRNLVVTQTNAQHLAAGELPAVDVACIVDAEISIHSPAGAVDFLTYEAENRGYTCGIVLDGFTLDVRTLGDVWGPRGAHHVPGTFRWPDGGTDCHLEIGPCHLKGTPLFRPGDRLEWGDMVQYMGWSGLVQPPGPKGKHLHLKVYIVKPGTAPTWTPFAFINPEILKARLGGGAA